MILVKIWVNPLSFLKLQDPPLTLRQIGGKLKIASSTVGDTIKRYEKHKTLESLPRSGRPRKTTPRLDDYIVRLMDKSEEPNSEALTHELKKMNLCTISGQTVKNRMHSEGIYGRNRVKKRVLKPEQIVARIKFGKSMNHGQLKTGQRFYGQMRQK